MAAGISAGQGAVVHGSSGTVKRQTIANLMATLAANGRRYFSLQRSEPLLKADGGSNLRGASMTRFSLKNVSLTTMI
jgi:hypothetical protein